MMDATAHATTTPSRDRLAMMVRRSDIMLWRRYERDILATAMVATRRIWAAYSYWRVRTGAAVEGDLGRGYLLV
jgi:hypothetical protein